MSGTAVQTANAFAFADELFEYPTDHRCRIDLRQHTGAQISLKRSPALIPALVCAMTFFIKRCAHSDIETSNRTVLSANLMIRKDVF